ncbi:MAG: 3-hydroxylacyl-ACP dehydratase [Hydrogenophaga sp.]|uniref:3-hydroxylacyl-ACP dehydratase n=1 Tax=Hydrogenophaga sp. TaxID=1904254 RepID=UPI001E008591|nr:3-hydroxylacyl-ACP dehydratase [Hydrogenophaga sp.]MBX3609923.1 3-hydroxylacyl-ACP dehydratase [Hydrogenophaga sp.]
MSPDTPLDRAWIAQRIPHQGSMCLLDAVQQWSDDAITCSAHIAPGTEHPLRRDGVLSSAHAIEYAAQAMAVHGALTAGDSPAPAAGYLASVRAVQLHHSELLAEDSPLQITAQRLSAVGANVMYGFRVASARGCLAEGRAAVVLDVGANAGASGGDA